MSKVVSNEVVSRYHKHNLQCSGKTQYLNEIINKSFMMIEMLWRQCLVRCHFTKHQNMEK